MKRRLARIAGFLASGIVLTYAIAWGMTFHASWHDTWSTPSVTLSTDPIEWLWPAPPGWPQPNERWSSVSLGGEHVEAAYTNTARPDTSLLLPLNIERRRRVGWPLLSLESRETLEMRTAPTAALIPAPTIGTDRVSITSLERGIRIAGKATFGEFNLPLLPRWPHFAASVLLYATLARALFLLPAYLRRRHRRRRNRCPACGYELMGAGMCPECGVASLPKKTPA